MIDVCQYISTPPQKNMFSSLSEWVLHEKAIAGSFNNLAKKLGFTSRQTFLSWTKGVAFVNEKNLEHIANYLSANYHPYKEVTANTLRIDWSLSNESESRSSVIQLAVNNTEKSRKNAVSLDSLQNRISFLEGEIQNIQGAIASMCIGNKVLANRVDSVESRFYDRSCEIPTESQRRANKV